ncbi:MAG: alpha/beta hydrolase-fold protein, partial [Planctomycetia bacterium]|nr:alpha/beta hydrolase-fold protein [Planctomycetia bacterium]
EHGLDRMIIVMPDAGRTWYVNRSDGRYEDYFFRELIPQIEKSYRCKTDRKYRAIAGLSMGGHGSLLYAIRHPEMFRTCYAMSAGIRTDEELRQMPLDVFQDHFDVKLNETDERITPEINANRVLPLVATVPESQRKSVRFFIDCGDDDFLIGGNCALHLEMRRMEIPHEFRVRDGAHNWEYWRTALPMAFEFIAEGTGESSATSY